MIFEALILRYSKNNSPSVVYFRDKAADSLFAGRLLIDLLSKTTSFITNEFTVLEEKNIRQRFYKQ
ncbi:MAG: hypothetical protein H7320_07565 [Ferruginibacter sp.]|nr:hypothetical protein [Ferruginibacter sp.]